MHMIDGVDAEMDVEVEMETEMELELDMEAGGDVAGEVRDFRKALADWARGYLATRRLGMGPEQFAAAFKADLRRWSGGYSARLAAPSTEERSVPAWGASKATPVVPAVLADMAVVTMAAADTMVFSMNLGATF